jgi:hypothetical protein
MNIQEFENHIASSESSTLDFKAELYDFENDKDKSNTAKFVKDIISFSNTIRTETSYIIFGVKKNENDESVLTGILKTIDDAILQDKIKDKVIPRPVFSYSTILYQEKLFGILTFPIEKYAMPIVPSIIGMKGLEAGKVYYRNGTSNTEASAYDVIRINDWLKSMPTRQHADSLNELISTAIKELIKKGKKLSEIITDLLSISKIYKLNDLNKFCLDELQGPRTKQGNYSYRIQTVMFSWAEININPYSFLKPTVQAIKQEMSESKDFFEGKLAISHPIVEIERYLEKLEAEPEGTYATMKSDSKTLLNSDKKYDLFIYFFPDNFIDLYGNIRQKAIDILMKI